MYVVDCFTPRSVGTKFPENTYECETVEDVAKVIRDCSRPIAGIVQVQVWIHPENEPANHPKSSESSTG